MFAILLAEAVSAVYACRSLRINAFLAHRRFALQFSIQNQF